MQLLPPASQPIGLCKPDELHTFFHCLSRPLKGLSVQGNFYAPHSVLTRIVKTFAMARTAEDILKEAILLETRGKAFYKNVAEKCDNKAAKEVFEMMAREEDEHIKFLSQQFKHYTKEHSFEKPTEPKEDPEETVVLKVLTDKIKKEVNAASFEAAAVSSAINFEMNAVKLYKSRAEEATDPNEKKLYEILTAWEGEHSRLLVDIDNHLKEEVWHDNDFWPF